MVNKNWVGADWEVVNEKLSKVTRGFVSAPKPVDLETVNENWASVISEIVKETDSIGDAWICQRQQALLTNK